MLHLQSRERCHVNIRANEPTTYVEYERHPEESGAIKDLGSFSLFRFPLRLLWTSTSTDFPSASLPSAATLRCNYGIFSTRLQGMYICQMGEGFALNCPIFRVRRGFGISMYAIQCCMSRVQESRRLCLLQRHNPIITFGYNAVRNITSMTYRVAIYILFITQPVSHDRLQHNVYNTTARQPQVIQLIT